MLTSLLKKLSFLSALSILAVSFSFSVNAESFRSGAKQAILFDFSSGTVLFEKNADERMGPSSMTKIMTTYIIFDALKNGDFTLDSKFKVSKKAWKKGGSKMFVEAGSYIRLENLIKGIVVQSGNDACIVVAEGFSKTEEAFAKDMNYMAERLGLENTNFTNSTGWPDENHYSTARDMAILSKRIIQDFPEYYDYFNQQVFTWSDITQRNRNTLLGKEGLGVDGLKTGHTEQAGYGIVVSAVQNGRRLVALVNGLNSEKRRISEAERLLMHGFNDFKPERLFEKNEIVEKVKVWGGENSYVPVAARKPVELIIERRKQVRPDYKLEVIHNEPWIAPIEAGTHMATLVVKKDDKIISQYPLFATRAVSEAGFLKRVYDKFITLTGLEIL